MQAVLERRRGDAGSWNVNAVDVLVQLYFLAGSAGRRHDGGTFICHRGLKADMPLRRNEEPEEDELDERLYKFIQTVYR